MFSKFYVRAALFLAAALLLIFFLIGRDNGLWQFNRGNGNLGKNFHRKTKMVWGKVAQTASALTEKPSAPAYKNYPGAERIGLPLPDDFRREVTNGAEFSKGPVGLGDLSHILFSANGILKKEGLTDIRTVTFPLPKTKSFSYFHPIEIYLLVKSVDGIKPGLYHYSAVGHSLELLKEGDIPIPDCCFTAPSLSNSAFLIILTGIPGRLSWRYDNRAWRYMYMAAGAVSQNIYTACASLGLGSSATASFYDDLYNKLLGLDGETETTLLLHLVGSITK